MNMKEEQAKKIFKSILEGCSIHFDDNFPKSLFYMKDGVIFFEIERNIIWCRHSSVWKPISLGMKGRKRATRMFIESQLSEHLKIHRPLLRIVD